MGLGAERESVIMSRHDPDPSASSLSRGGPWQVNRVESPKLGGHRLGGPSRTTASMSTSSSEAMSARTVARRFATSASALQAFAGMRR